MASQQTDRELIEALMRSMDPYTYPQGAPNVPKMAGQQLLDFAQALGRDPNRRATGLEEVVELIGKMGVINPLKTAGSLMQLDKPTVERMAQSGVEAAKRAYDDPSGAARRVAQGAKEALLDPVGTAGELSVSDVVGGSGLLSKLAGGAKLTGPALMAAMVPGSDVPRPKRSESEAIVDASKRVDSPNIQTLKGFEEGITAKYPDVEEFSLYSVGDDIELNRIVVNKYNRNKGVGTDVMKELTDYADENGKRLILTTNQADQQLGTTSSGRLKDFYKRFGFVENVGKNKDFRIKSNMYRSPIVANNNDAYHNLATDPTASKPKTVDIWHNSPNSELTGISESNTGDTFSGLFGNEGGSDHGGRYSFKFDIPQDEILSHSDFTNTLPYEKTKAAVEKVAKENGLSVDSDLIDELWDYIAEDKSVFDELRDYDSGTFDEDKLYALTGEFDLGEGGWKIQKMRGQVARELGYSAVEMNDEYGVSTLIVNPNIKPSSRKDLETGDIVDLSKARQTVEKLGAGGVDVPSGSPLKLRAKDVGPDGAWRGDLSAEFLTDKLFRETSVDRALELLPNTPIRTDLPPLFFSNTPDIALGQRQNKGVLLEFDAPKDLKVRVNKNMPAWEVAWENGAAEFEALRPTQEQLSKNLRRIIIRPDAEIDKVSRIQMQRAVKGLKDAGWAVEKLEDGSIALTRQ